MSRLLSKLKKEPQKFTLKDKQDLVVEYTYLIRFIAQKIASKLPANVEVDDLISSGVIGLMDAIDKYDPRRDNQFKTYAEFRIRGAILDELRSQDWVPRSVREKSKVLERAYKRLEQRHGRAVSPREIAKNLKVSLSKFHEMVALTRSTSLISMDDTQHFPFKDRKEMMSVFEDTKFRSPHVQADLNDVKEILKDALEELPQNERMVLALYYYEDMNLKEIGSVLDVTESRISQIHSQAMKNLRDRVKKILGE